MPLYMALFVCGLIVALLPFVPQIFGILLGGAFCAWALIRLPNRWVSLFLLGCAILGLLGLALGSVDDVRGCSEVYNWLR